MLFYWAFYAMSIIDQANDAKSSDLKLKLGLDLLKNSFNLVGQLQTKSEHISLFCKIDERTRHSLFKIGSNSAHVQAH